MAVLAKLGLCMMIRKVHLVLGQGDFVVSQSEGVCASKEATFHDLFRVESGTISDHWAIIEELFPKAAWKNSYGKF